MVRATVGLLPPVSTLSYNPIRCSQNTDPRSPAAQVQKEEMSKPEKQKSPEELRREKLRQVEACCRSSQISRLWRLFGYLSHLSPKLIRLFRPQSVRAWNWASAQAQKRLVSCEEYKFMVRQRWSASASSWRSSATSRRLHLLHRMQYTEIETGKSTHSPPWSSSSAAAAAHRRRCHQHPHHHHHNHNQSNTQTIN